MDIHLAGIICHVASIFATSALITTTEGKVHFQRATRPTVETSVCSASQIHTNVIGFSFLLSGASHKDGYETFASWKKVWTSNGKSEPSLKAFMADQQLPFWVSSGECDCYVLHHRHTSAHCDMFLLGSMYQTGL